MLSCFVVLEIIVIISTFVPECTLDIFSLSEHLFLGPPLISDCPKWIHPLQLISGAYCVCETKIVSDPDRKYSGIMVLPG